MYRNKYRTKRYRRSDFSCQKFILSLTILLFLFNFKSNPIIDFKYLFSQVQAHYQFKEKDIIKITDALLKDNLPQNSNCAKCNFKTLRKIDNSSPKDVCMTTIINKGSGTVQLARNIRTVSNATFIVLTDVSGYHMISKESKDYINNCGGLVIKLSAYSENEFFYSRYKTKIDLYHSFTQRFFGIANRITFFDSQDFLFQDLIFNEDENYSVGLTLFPERFALKNLNEYNEIKQKTQDFGGIDFENFAEKGVINGCCGAGIGESVAELFDLVLKDLNHYHRITDQSMFAYYAYNDMIQNLTLHYDGMLMADQTPVNYSVFGLIRELNETEPVKGKFKWLHHLNHNINHDFSVALYKQCPRDNNSITNYSPYLTDDEIIRLENAK